MTLLVHDFIKKIISHLISDCILQTQLPPAHCQLLHLDASSKLRLATCSLLASFVVNPIITTLNMPRLLYSSSTLLL